MSKRPIDSFRDAAVTMEIGDDSDASAIQEMIALPNRMLFVKEHGLWQSQLADNIDPDRTNPSIPNTMQKLLSRGAADPMVGRTLLQAKRLLKSSMLPASVSAAQGMEVTLALLNEFSVLADKAADYQQALRTIDAKYQENKALHGSLQVPSIGDVTARGKSFIQGADHAIRTLWSFVRIFQPELPHGVNWRKLQERLKSGNSREQRLAPLVNGLEPPFRFLRNTRNAIEHPKPGQEVILLDYQLRPDGNVHCPSIQVVEKETPLSETTLAAFFEQTIELLVNAYQIFLINLCAIHVRSISGFTVEVIELEAIERRYAEVKFAYASLIGDRLAPFAD